MTVRDANRLISAGAQDPGNIGCLPHVVAGLDEDSAYHRAYCGGSVVSRHQVMA